MPDTAGEVMAAIGRYCTQTHMFVEPARTVNRERLRFMRWLADAGELEHHVEGAPSGPLTDDDDAPGGDIWPWSAFADREPA